MVMVHIKLNSITKCSNIVANLLPADPPYPQDPGDGVSRSKFNSLEQGHVAYQIKGNLEMQQHVSKYFARRPSPAIAPTPGMGPVGQDSTFSEHGHVAYQIKENHECSNKVPNILPADSLPPPYPQPWGWGQ